MELSIELWERASSAEREGIARQLAKQLPEGFSFQGIRAFGFGERQHEVALYQNGNFTFSLIPGGIVSIGYDADRAWEPNQDELESWQGTCEEYGIKKTIQEYIGEVTLRVREVELSPFLVENGAVELGWREIGVDDAEVREILRKYEKGKTMSVHRGEVNTRVRTGEDGSIVAERSMSQTHAQMVAPLHATGFRLPTSDEWEYCCGRGEPNLFRWGDHVPCDRYPTDISPAEAEWRRHWVRSHGKLGYPAGGFTSDWDHHRQPNAFGLLIASNPYEWELTEDAGITRGGDGGCAVCGGTGFFVGWLPLATAYFEEQYCKYDKHELGLAGHGRGRRVLELE
jgi:hypothetical protein